MACGVLVVVSLEEPNSLHVAYISEVWGVMVAPYEVEPLLLLLLYFKRRMQPIGYSVSIYILGLKPFDILWSVQFLIKHSVEVLLLFCSDSPRYLPSVMLSAAYKRMKRK